MGTKQSLFVNRTQATLFTTLGAGNYTIPSGAISLAVVVKAGAGGGGSGRRGAAGSIRCGGGSGSPGGIIRMVLSVADLLVDFPSGVIPLNVGFGGTGGGAQTVDNSNGVNGNNGDLSWLGSATYLVAMRGGAGGGGTAAGGAADRKSVV